MVNHQEPVSELSALPAMHVVVMGVAGCGKSAVGRLMANQLDIPLVEGDEFHSAENIRKMQQGVPLTDADRAGWLRTLAMELVHHPLGMVLTCSALKSAYRNSLRCATPNLYFVHLAITEEEALRRVSQRAGHFYPASLVASQFEALEDPSTEAGVLVLNGNSVKDQAVTAVAWLNARSHTL